MGVTDYDIALVVVSPFVAAATLCLFILVGRGLRHAYRSAARLLRRWVGPRAATALAGAWSSSVTCVVTGLLLDGLVTVADKAFSLRNTTTPEGVAQPTSGLRSGGPGSVVPWDSLGLEGRTFTGLGPSSGDIEAVVAPPGRGADQGLRRVSLRPRRRVPSGARGQGPRAGGRLPAHEPAGVHHDGQRLGRPRARRPVRVPDRRRRGDRGHPVLLPARRGSPSSSTSPRRARPDGPSSTRSTTGGRSCRPDQRPRLFVAGESLGTFGGETAFSGEYDLRNRTAGTRLSPGRPTSTPCSASSATTATPAARRSSRSTRTAGPCGSRATPAASIPPEGQPWDGTRVLYLMHPSDPIVWWSPEPHLHRARLDRRTARQGRPPGDLWMPFVTFWQVTADLPFSTGVPGRARPQVRGGVRRRVGRGPAT